MEMASFDGDVEHVGRDEALARLVPPDPGRLHHRGHRAVTQALERLATIEGET